MHKEQQVFDLAIIGSGAAGLALLNYLYTDPIYQDYRILIIDQDFERVKNRQWAFWSSGRSELDSIIAHSWSRVRVVTEQGEKIQDLSNYKYQLVYGRDLDGLVKSKVSQRSVMFIQDYVRGINPGQDLVKIKTNEMIYTSKLAFDSRFGHAQLDQIPQQNVVLKQNFLGLHIKTRKPSFDPTTFTYMDFWPYQSEDMIFFYQLPIALDECFVYCVSLELQSHEQLLQQYLAEHSFIYDYQIVGREAGQTVLTDFKFPRRLARRVYAIGIPAGMIKPSSGYGFSRILLDSRRIAEHVKIYYAGEVTIQLSSAKKGFLPGYLYRLLDQIMLRAMLRYPREMGRVYSRLLTGNPILRVVRFLEEETNLGEIALIVWSAPKLFFIKVSFWMIWEKLFKQGDVDQKNN